MVYRPSKENQKITQEKYPDFHLKPIATWKTTIMSIKKVTKGSFIGYDRAFEAQHDMTIAILPIGYYDGYDFRLFNKAVGDAWQRICTYCGTHFMNLLYY